MSETGNIEKLAKIVSNDIFKWFKWDTCKPKDVDWSCELDHHCKKTHPSDVVFHYDDPYSGYTKYLNTDLKSYAAGSISRPSLTKALKSLALSVECANISASWQDKFLLDDVGFGDVSGLLFIYNHDSKYDKDFHELVESVEYKEITIAEENELIIMGPNLIQRFCDVVSDMKMLKADDSFPGPKDYTFFYPDLIRSRRCGDEWGKPATIEALTSPWLIVKHRGNDDFKSGFVIYYHQSGESVEEFIYLIDAMSHYQMFSGDYTIRIRFTGASTHAPTNFEKAKHEYLKMWGNDEGRREQMESIQAEQITNFTTTFNPMEIGMREDV
ncbi:MULTISPECIES: DUF438 domain-containing protein [unclassified Pseudoalteromonas]|uniref:DUF438 domain-containing protein n=1 Tax=unclassified Pseudoalteromonas TaxID=194690 RepID=UPI001F3535F0|nr:MULTISPECIES: DUF438 domain-containing protein [unclassified Pseudoalteromonas]MCF2829599.1 DUF438 domain-containing protein [Pseudoalteromonas sp. OF5H-5]MCF2830855.1 DUF438 domain-containing protein [Pseudoalteromonas sp. DL2-H6]MCF2927317.1 DUF438 domain-containing protein [Pseudoalteromonas sp. DL2-H1]